MKIAILGNLAGVANEMLLGLRQAGVEADLFIRHLDRANTFDDLTGQGGVQPEWVHYLDPPPAPAASIFRTIPNNIHHSWAALFNTTVVSKLAGYDLLHSHTATLIFPALSYLKFVQLKRKPYLAFATGSDIRETARFGKGLRGYLVRKYFRNAARTLLLNVDMLGLRSELGLENAQFFPFPIDETKHAPQTGCGKPPEYRDKLLLFMMSSLDFGISDNTPDRSSMKLNDRVLYALAEFVKIDPAVHLIALDRGPDREEAKRLVAKLNLPEYVTFLPPQSELDRIRLLNQADIVLDQFNPGAFGLGALETLSVGRPLITYVREDYLPACYGDLPPILNARTSEQILARLLEARDPGLRNELGSRSRQWLLKHHARKPVIDKLIRLYEETLS